jgi:hypothetical protein
LENKKNKHPQVNKHPTIDPVCSICGREDEDDHHALIRCTLARALREEMRNVWELPTEEDLQVTGPEWLLTLLHGMSVDMRSRTLFLLWRVWHHRNNIVHGDGKASVAASATFIRNYMISFSSVEPISSNSKGKENVTSNDHLAAPIPMQYTWTPPGEGTVKWMQDGIFLLRGLALV